MPIGEFIKKLREKRGLNQNELAELLYVDPSLVCKWEKGKKRVTVDTLLVLLDLLKVTPEEFKELRDSVTRDFKSI